MLRAPLYFALHPNASLAPGSPRLHARFTEILEVGSAADLGLIDESLTTRWDATPNRLSNIVERIAFVSARSDGINELTWAVYIVK